eukprot:746677-Hanusia_phi.AAC.1
MRKYSHRHVHIKKTIRLTAHAQLSDEGKWKKIEQPVKLRLLLAMVTVVGFPSVSQVERGRLEQGKERTCKNLKIRSSALKLYEQPWLRLFGRAVLHCASSDDDDWVKLTGSLMSDIVSANRIRLDMKEIDEIGASLSSMLSTSEAKSSLKGITSLQRRFLSAGNPALGELSDWLSRI